MRRICPLLAAFAVFIGLGYISPPAHADNKISSIEMDIYIDTDGTAHVSEFWSANLDSGTEGYKPYGNLGGSEIIDFSVKDDTGVEYTNVGDWTGYGSFEYKKHKSGINRSGDKVELCWGISEYGWRSYYLTYKITNFVNQYTDAQGVYFGLIPQDMLQSVDSVKIKITADHAFNEENAKIWGFGYSGEIIFKDGAIVMDSNGYFPRSSYMVALIKFEEDYVTSGSGYPTDKSFDEELELAMEGTVREQDDNPSTSSGGGSNDGSGGGSYGGGSSSESTNPFVALVTFLGNLFMVIFPLGFFIFIQIWLRKGTRTWAKDDFRMDFTATGGMLPPIEQVNYWREIPCGGDLEKAYWLIIQYGMHDKKDAEDAKTGLMGAYILQWLHEGKIKLGGDGSTIVFQNYNDTNELFKFFVEGVQNTGGVLEQRAFKKYCERNYSKLKSWYYRIIRSECDRLVAKGALTQSTERDPRFRFSKRMWKVYSVTPIVRDEALKLLGLKRFLLDFSIIAQREAVEVHLWDDYLMFAQLLGIADKVRDQFKRLYPDFDQATPVSSAVAVGAAAGVAALGYKSIVVAHRRATSYSGSSSGRGGSSFSGGGGGSRGGGSRGGGFR